MSEGADAVALIFPGQGTQWVGMGADLYRQFPEVRAAFAEADDALGESLSTLCFEGPESTLGETTSAQPAILTCSVAAWRAIAARQDVRPVGAAGHSLGEFSALVVSGAIGLADGVRLVRARGQFMDEVGNSNGGAGMLALLGLDADEAEAVAALAADQSGTPVAVANVNCAGQVVLGGANAGLEVAAALARARGARRAQRLPISVASHTPLMREAALRLADYVAQVTVSRPAFPVVGNAYPEPIGDADAIRREVAAQLERPLNWPACVGALTALGASVLWEIGPKSVLAGLCKRVTGSPAVRTLVTAVEIESLCDGTMEA
ncbi:MAG: ACP S-malonyltransferase [Anaerolineae bacterium]